MKKYFQLFPVFCIFLLISCSQNFDPNKTNAYIINYSTSLGTAPKPIALVEGTTLTSAHLPAISTPYYSFSGWFLESQKIEPGYIISKELNLNARWILDGFDFDWTDTSDVAFYTSNVRSDLSAISGCTKATATKSSNSISNWMLNYNQRQLDNVCGFEGKVKCNAGIKWTGFQWYDNANFDYYGFQIYNNGSFYIYKSAQEEKEYLLKLTAENANITPSEFNFIKLSATPKYDFEVYLNDNLVYTIKNSDLKINPGRIAYAYTTNSNLSSSSPGYAWFQLTQFQKIR